ncbi:MAG: WYL domain-containing protein [Bacteroidales bacterium]|nr:WYL domain-containing protein [Bacteroidales bacterium]
MSEASQKKLRQMLELLLMLNNKYGRSKQALAEHFRCTQRTINRYLNTFKEVGFVIENNKGYVKIDKENSDYKDLSELLHFSEDESLILTKAIDSIDTNTQLKELLKKKLYSIYNFDRVASPVVKRHGQQIVQKLLHAISDKRQVQLIQYRSANSNDISNRIVEPFDFTQNYTSVWAFEPEAEICKTFKISRVSKIEILSQNFLFEEKHQKGRLDVFRMTGNKNIPVHIRLSLKAYNLLIEEFPRAEYYIQKKNDNLYDFEADVHSLYGIGRFVLGLPSDIEVVEPQSLRDYLIDEMKKGIKKLK